MRALAIALIGGIIGTIFASTLVIAWTGPTSAPPNGNVAAPINVGTTAQVKNGGLSVNTLAVFGNGTLSGKFGIGSSTPWQKLSVAGNVLATGEVIGTLASGYGQLRMVRGNYGAFWRNDGTNTYFLLTAAGSPYGSWNTLRPFTVNNATGNVTIGTPLTVNNTVTATAYLHSSDARLKENIATIDGASIVARLRGVTFDWKADAAHASGVIAQEVETVMPWAVHTAADGTKSVDYDQIIPALIEAIKAQQAEIDALKAARR